MGKFHNFAIIKEVRKKFLKMLIKNMHFLNATVQHLRINLSELQFAYILLESLKHLLLKLQIGILIVTNRIENFPFVFSYAEIGKKRHVKNIQVVFKTVVKLVIQNQSFFKQKASCKHKFFSHIYWERFSHFRHIS